MSHRQTSLGNECSCGHDKCLHWFDLGSKGNVVILPYRFLSGHAAVVCAIQEMISWVTTEPKYFKVVTVSGLCPIALVAVMPLVLLVTSLVLLALIAIPSAGSRGFVDAVLTVGFFFFFFHTV